MPITYAKIKKKNQLFIDNQYSPGNLGNTENDTPRVFRLQRFTKSELFMVFAFYNRTTGF